MYHLGGCGCNKINGGKKNSKIKINKKLTKKHKNKINKKKSRKSLKF